LEISTLPKAPENFHNFSEIFRKFLKTFPKVFISPFLCHSGFKLLEAGELESILHSASAFCPLDDTKCCCSAEASCRIDM
jgi:hypothetical protein